MTIKRTNCYQIKIVIFDTSFQCSYEGILSHNIMNEPALKGQFMEFWNLNFSLDSSDENLQIYNFIELPLSVSASF